MILCKTYLSELLILIMGIGIAVAALVAAVIVNVVSTRRTKQRNAEESAALKKRMESEYKVWCTTVVLNNGLKPISSNICLMGDERCFYSDDAVLYEPRSVRNSTHLGGGVRVARGVVIGGGNSWSESHDEWRAISSGTLYITNKRIIFDGEMHDRTIKFSALTVVQAGIQELTISCSTRQKTMVFGGINARIARDTIRLLQKASIGR
jgi:hypothetical protein